MLTRRALSTLVIAVLLALCFIAPAYAVKNVILMIGDGMGPNQVRAGAYYLGGSGGSLCFEPYYRASVTTYSRNSAITDSAAAASALATGYKVNNGVISQSPIGTPYQTILEMAGTMGKKTGLVTTVPISHATPAGFGAHETSRNSYISITDDYLNSSRPNVLFGGGNPSRTTTDTYVTDAQVTRARSLGYNVVTDYNSMANLNPATDNYVMGLFADEYMSYEYGRAPSSTEPHLSQMTASALSLLDNDPDGFFLMIEGGMIDTACHLSDSTRTAKMTREVVEFDNSVQTVLDWLQGRDDTMLIVTADHETGGLTSVTSRGIGQYPTANWTKTDHTATNVPFYITGAGADLVNPYITNGLINNTDVYRVMNSAFAIPEPSSFAVLALGLIGLLRRRRAQS